MFSFLYDLKWHRVCLQLKNTRNVHGKEHPLAIFEAVFKNARTMAGREVELDFVFHPAGYQLPERIGKNRVYALELLFFRTEPVAIAAFLANLRLHLADWRNNFTLHEVAAIEPRSLRQLEAEQGPWPTAGDEICLEFLSPFPFTPKIKDKGARQRRTIIDRDTFFNHLLERVGRAFGPEAGNFSLPPDSWQEFRLLPYYWEYREEKHLPKSNQGEQELIKGGQGPLYVKGPIERIYPLLLLCSEINASRSPAKGRGYYLLKRERPFFDLRLQNFGLLRGVYDAMARESDISEELRCALAGPEAMLRELHGALLAGGFQPAPFSGFTVAKKSGGRRLIAIAEPRDHLVQKLLQDLLAPTVDRMFEECSIGFRRGRSRQEAKTVVAAAVRQGFTHVFESDIESFFDMIDWQVMTKRLSDLLPRADRLTLALLDTFIRAELQVDGRPCPRARGLIQGMVLAPLLANLYLDTFDEEMTALGYWLVRYGDDFLVLTRSRAEGEEAQRQAAAILERLRLDLKAEKTAVTALDAGFSFLGFDFGPELDEVFIDHTALRKTVFIRSLYAFVGIDSDSLIVRKDKELLSRLPLNRVGEIVLFGDNTVSTRLLQACNKGNIPVSFCQAGGRYLNTLRPDSKAYFAMAALHAKRFEATTEAQRLVVARLIVSAKLAGYLAWLAARYGSKAKEECLFLQDRLAVLPKADRVEALRGYEGEAAGRVYDFIRTVTVDPLFQESKTRRPRAKCNRWNVLLDFASSLIFSRLNVLLRSQGLNPYLGFLHSHKDTYESLVCDLQEPFRARMDRFVLKVVNLKMIRAAHFEFSKQFETYAMTRDGVGVFLEAFEREMNVRLAEDGGTLKQLLVAQVQVLRQWVAEEGRELFFFRPKGD